MLQNSIHYSRTRNFTQELSSRRWIIGFIYKTLVLVFVWNQTSPLTCRTDGRQCQLHSKKTDNEENKSPALAAVAEPMLNVNISSPPESAYPSRRRSSSAKPSSQTPNRAEVPSSSSAEVKSPSTDRGKTSHDVSGRRNSTSDRHSQQSGQWKDTPSGRGDSLRGGTRQSLATTAGSPSMKAEVEPRTRRSRHQSIEKPEKFNKPQTSSSSSSSLQQQQQQQQNNEEVEELSFSKELDLLVAKNSKPIVVLELLDAKTLKSVVSGGRIKTDSEIIKRSMKRPLSSDEDDDDGPLSKKKRRKRNKRLNQRALSVEELLDSATFKKFAQAIEHVFDTAEEVDFGSLDPNDEETECPPESLISKQVLSEICGEAAKLKAQKVTNQIPADKLVKLLTILQWNVRDGVKLTPNIRQDDDDEDDEETVMWRELAMERVMKSMDASLAALYIMTAPEMPKQVYLDDVIERIILFGKWQLQNTVFPEFDPVYKIDPHSKGGYQGNLKSKRARAHTVKHKSTIMLYNKLCELISALGELLDIQELTDTVILQVSTLGVSPFFVENISEMQLNSMKLVTNIFSKYDKHRQLILEDIFASLARLPSTKRNLRNYRLNANESIQMVTALALQLIQCVVKLPVAKQKELEMPAEEKPDLDKSAAEKDKKKKGEKSDGDVIIVTSYETAMRTGYNFLSVFLKKCTAKSEDDYRPLFENFVQDLLSTVNKPEWPASELLLSLLGRILVQQFSNKSTDMSLRVASLEYLGIVAARLRSDAVSSQMNQEVIDEIVEKADACKNQDDDKKKEKKKEEESNDSKQTKSLQLGMLNYLAENTLSDPALLFARQFYIAQWYRDITVEAEKAQKKADKAEKDEDEEEMELMNKSLHLAENGKQFLLSVAEIQGKPLGTMRTLHSPLDYEDACLVARFLSSKRPFAQSFDIYLTQILRVLSETAVAVRTKAMKCLSAVVEADPGILARDDMQRGVHGRFLDQSTSVREAAVELVGKFILIRPELIPKYYDMLCDRILDTGISVRKRVIKIFKDICLEQPEFSKIPEMCVKMIRRVNDEEGIKKLVNEVFQLMWFLPLRGNDMSKLVRRVLNITEVVSACKDTGMEFFEQLLENLLKKDEDGNFNKSALQASKQIVDCLVENVLSLEERSVDGESTTNPQRLIACLTTLFLFSRIKADLMLPHAMTLQPYLDIKCNTQGDVLVLHNVARILELVVPLMEHPSESFLMQLEEDMMKLILKHGMMVLQSCVSCLGAVVNKVSHNYRLVKDCFQKFFGVISKLMADHKENPNNPTLVRRRPTLLRSLFTVGLLCRHFDFDSKEMGETKVKSSIKDRVFDVLSYFIEHEDEEVRIKALTGVGFMCVRHYEYMLGRTMKGLYYYLLTDYNASVKLKIQALKNLQCYLVEEEIKMIKADAEWRKKCKAEDLRDMGDVQSGMASTIIQVYLKQVLESFISANSQVRQAALEIIQIVLRQGLIHPVQCVPYLITMGTELDPNIRVKSDQQLQDIDKKYPGFIHMKALQGIKMSYKLQSIIQNPSEPIRGLRTQDGIHHSLNAFLYTVLRGNRGHRRAFLTSLLNLFDDSDRASLEELLYIADNLAFFPYQSQDEPLFVIHQIDIIVSVSGSNLLQSFKENLMPGKKMEKKSDVYDEDDEEEIDNLLERLPPDINPLLDVCRVSQGCVLLLVLKQHLKELYGFTDSKIHRYSPAEGAKMYDKPMSRKFAIDFNPSSTLDLIKQGPRKEVDDSAKRKMIEEYLDFKQLMLSIDPPDEDDESDDNTNVKGQKQRSGVEEGQTVEIGGKESEGQDSSVMNIPDKVSDGSDGIKPRSQPHTPHHNMRSQHYAALFEKKKKVRLTPKATPPPKPPKKKARKRKRRLSDSDEDIDSEDDPDFIA
ncbi:SCC2 [Acanthosepion pharaonis]|uniref:Nipped-B protein n=1 Tax=Acanthosepion pharaonis TaxID=158019 RepID=A0A812DHK1_ACAPH|nr:SCC2 [Sepia pharaonis]